MEDCDWIMDVSGISRDLSIDWGPMIIGGAGGDARRLPAFFDGAG